jgi:hypothetical protein
LQANTLKTQKLTFKNGFAKILKIQNNRNLLEKVKGYEGIGKGNDQPYPEKKE